MLSICLLDARKGSLHCNERIQHAFLISGSSDLTTIAFSVQASLACYPYKSRHPERPRGQTWPNSPAFIRVTWNSANIVFLASSAWQVIYLLEIFGVVYTQLSPSRGLSARGAIKELNDLPAKARPNRPRNSSTLQHIMAMLSRLSGGWLEVEEAQPKRII